MSEVKKKTDRLTVLVNNSGATWGAPYDDFPEQQGWDKIMALNVKAIFYTTVGLDSLLRKGATPDHPSRVINSKSALFVKYAPNKESLSQGTFDLALIFGQRGP